MEDMQMANVEMIDMRMSQEVLCPELLCLLMLQSSFSSILPSS